MALRDGILAYWKLDGNSLDSVGSANGADTNVTYTQQRINTGGNFSDTSKILISNTIPTSLAISVAFWVRPDDLLTEDKYFCRDWNGGTDWGIVVGQNGASQFDCGVRTVTNWRSVNDPTTYSAGTSYFLTVTYDGTVLNLYKNAVIVASTSPGEALENMASKEIRIGCLNTATQLVDAGIDEVGFWGRALTQSEITTLMNNISYPFHDRGFIVNNLRPSMFVPGIGR